MRITSIGRLGVGVYKLWTLKIDIAQEKKFSLHEIEILQIVNFSKIIWQKISINGYAQLSKKRPGTLIYFVEVLSKNHQKLYSIS